MSTPPLAAGVQNVICALFALTIVTIGGVAVQQRFAYLESLAPPPPPRPPPWPPGRAPVPPPSPLAPLPAGMSYHEAVLFNVTVSSSPSPPAPPPFPPPASPPPPSLPPTSRRHLHEIEHEHAPVGAAATLSESEWATALASVLDGPTADEIRADRVGDIVMFIVDTDSGDAAAEITTAVSDMFFTQALGQASGSLVSLTGGPTIEYHIHKI